MKRSCHSSLICSWLPAELCHTLPSFVFVGFVQRFITFPLTLFDWLPIESYITTFPSSILLGFLQIILSLISPSVLHDFLHVILSLLSLHLFLTSAEDHATTLFIYSLGLSVECRISTLPSSILLDFLQIVLSLFSLHLFSLTSCGVSCYHSL